MGKAPLDTQSEVTHELPQKTPTILTQEDVSLLEENISTLKFTQADAQAQPEQAPIRPVPMPSIERLPKNDHQSDLTDGSPLKVSHTEIVAVSDLADQPEGNMDESNQDNYNDAGPKTTTLLTTEPVGHATEIQLDMSIETKIDEGAKGAIHQLRGAVLNLSSEVNANGGSKILTVSLNPGELGEVQVEVSSQHDGSLSARLIVEKSQTFELLQQDMHQLKAVLNEIGIESSDISLSVNVNTQGSNEQSQREYVQWDEQELVLARELSKQVTESKTEVLDKPTYYLKRISHNHLNIET